MQPPARPLRLAAIAVAAVVAAGACQSDGDGTGAPTGAGTPIEEPSSVTEPSEPTDAPEPTDDPPTATTAPPDAEDDTGTDDPTASTRVLITSPEKSTPTIVVGEPSTETVYEVGTIDPGLAPFVAIATAHLTDRLGIDPDSIEVLTAVLVVWPDSALGCRQPDLVYAPVLTDGSVIELGVDGLVYRYHSGGERTPFPCDLPLDPPPPPVT